MTNIMTRQQKYKTGVKIWFNRSLKIPDFYDDCPTKPAFFLFISALPQS